MPRDPLTGPDRYPGLERRSERLASERDPEPLHEQIARGGLPIGSSGAQDLEESTDRNLAMAHLVRPIRHVRDIRPPRCASPWSTNR